MTALAAGSRVLVVCTGNICRSPFGEHTLRRLAEGAGCLLEVRSAGTFAMPGRPATDEAIQVAAELGVDLSGHRASALTEAGIVWADLVLAMTEEHARAVAPLVPEAAGLCVLDVDDPYGGDLAVYRRCFAEIARSLEPLVAGPR